MSYCPEGLMWDLQAKRCFYPRPSKGKTRKIGLCPENTVWSQNLHTCVPYFGGTDKMRLPIRIRYFANFEDLECPICLEEIEPNQQYTKLPCGHLFHTQCIDSWEGPCPMCRAARRFSKRQRSGKRRSKRKT